MSLAFTETDSGAVPLPTKRQLESAIKVLEMLSTYYRIAGYDNGNSSETPATGMRKSSLLKATQEILIGKASRDED